MLDVDSGRQFSMISERKRKAEVHFVVQVLHAKIALGERNPTLVTLGNHLVSDIR